MGIFLLKTSWLWESRNLFMQMVQCFETYLLSFCNILTIKTKKKTFAGFDVLGIVILL